MATGNVINMDVERAQRAIALLGGIDARKAAVFSAELSSNPSAAASIYERANRVYENLTSVDRAGALASSLRLHTSSPLVALGREIDRTGVAARDRGADYGRFERGSV